MRTDQELIEGWISEQSKASTTHIYRLGITYFQKWWNKPLAKFLELSPEDMRHRALEYQSFLANDLKRKQNTVVTFMTALQSLCSYKCKPLLLRRKRVGIAIDLHSHVFSNGDLSRMFDVANTEQKALLATMTSLGWEISAILELRRDFIEPLLKRAKEEHQRYIYFQNQRQKTNVLRLGVLNPLAIEWLNKWLEYVKSRLENALAHPKDKSVQTRIRRFYTDNLFSSYTSKNGVNHMLQHLARDANLTLRGSVHTHQIRKWVMSGLSRARFNSYQIKYVLGKQIPASDSTYLQTLQQEVEQYYPEAFEHYLNLRPEKVVQVIDMAKEKEIEELKAELEKLKSERATVENANITALKLIETVDRARADMNEKLAFLKKIEKKKNPKK